MFYRGQEIVCIVESCEWRHYLLARSGIHWSGPLPELDEIYHCDGYVEPFPDGAAAIKLQELPDLLSFEASGFRPLIKVEDFVETVAPAPKETVDV